MKKHKLRNKLATIFNTIENSKEKTDRQAEQLDAILVLVSSILDANGRKTTDEIEYAQTYLADNLNLNDPRKIREKLSRSYSESDITDSATKLKVLDKDKKEAIVLSLIEIACYDDINSEHVEKLIKLVSCEFEIESSSLRNFYEQGIKESKKKLKIFNSTSGLFMAVFIIILFILALTYLKSVVFGLILACFFLPLQGWIKRNVVSTKPAKLLSKAVSVILFPVSYPFKKLKSLITGNRTAGTSNEKNIETKRINLSCNLTLLSLICFIFIALGGISWLSTTSFSSLTNSISNWAEKTTDDYEIHQQIESGTTQKAAEENVRKDEKKSSIKHLFDAMIYKIGTFKPAIENSPLFKPVKNWLVKYIKQNENKGNLQSILLSKSGGIFTLTAGAVSTLISFLMNLVFTLFFFTFFLNQMAKLNSRLDKKGSYGQYIVRGFFSSGWFPEMNKETFKGTVIIIDNILEKLNSWVKGYLSIIIIETTFYVTTFLLTGVPYGLGLGLLAGMTILVPYIGPMISFLLTVSVCLVFGSGGMIQVIIVVLLYALMNGLLEQFFIYPALVGSALGLNEFETIIVVLIGGMLGGITGLIFAVPIASILKYLIPKIYLLISKKRLIS